MNTTETLLFMATNVPSSRVLRSWGSIVSLACLAGAVFTAEFDHQHARLDQVLRRHVHEGLVDYRALRVDPKPLDTYLAETAAVSEQQFQQWKVPQQLAFLFNLYNAATLRLILDHYPLASIKDIGWVLKGPWDQKVVKLFGRTITLGEVEHDILRKRYNEPRLHFALVCAARGCPPLRAEAYVAERLEEQLESQGRLFLGAAAKNRADLDAKVLYLSPIFKWFDEDFARTSGSVVKFVAPYFSPPAREAIRQGRLSIRYTEYDWSLNEAAVKSSP